MTKNCQKAFGTQFAETTASIKKIDTNRKSNKIKN
jgi:hypothetical protein